MADTPTFALTEFGFSAQFVYELAMGDLTPKEVCDAYGISKTRFKELLDNPVFMVMYNKVREEMLERGMTLKTKALIITENGLSMLHDMISNVEAPPSARMEAMKLAAQLAGVGAKTAQDAQQGPGLGITFVFSQEVPKQLGGRVIEHQSQ
jgi:hypothetical protein